MADKPQMDTCAMRENLQISAFGGAHPAWLRLIEYCAALGHGEIQNLKIQDGKPMMAEVTTKKVKFSP